MTASSHLPYVRQPLPPAVQALSEQPAGIVRQYDGMTVEAIVEQAREQTRAEMRAEMRAELTAAAEAVETAEWFHAAWLATAPLQSACLAVRRLCEGRPGHHHLPVDAILGALDSPCPATEPRPMTLTWAGVIAPPAGDRPGETTLIGCDTTLGGRAVLELADDQRQDLAARLAATVHPAEACATPGCGLPDNTLNPASPGVSGWIRLDVAGTADGPRWWCSPPCATAAMTAAGAELAAADHLAAVDPGRQAPEPLYGGDVVQFISDAYDSLADMEADFDAVEDAPETIPFVRTPGSAADVPDEWPPSGGHNRLCAYTAGISRTCTCTDNSGQGADA